MSPLPNRPAQSSQPLSPDTPIEPTEEVVNSQSADHPIDASSQQARLSLNRPVPRPPQAPAAPPAPSPSPSQRDLRESRSLKTGDVRKFDDALSTTRVASANPETSGASNPSPATVSVSSAIPESEGFPSLRHQPIPAPSEPMQYRAIGLLRGRYQPENEEQFTRGTMTTTDGTLIEAVLLGRVMSLVKNHLDLSQEHLWVVYPRTREKQDDLHVQIVGVWEPENLTQTDDPSPETEGDEALGEKSEAAAPPTPTLMPSSEVEDNYFSVRGEVIFHTPEEDSIVVKIQQAPRKKNDRQKMFKLTLKGSLAAGKVVGYFWDLQVQRQGSELLIREARSIGLIPPKKRPKGEKGNRPLGGGRKPPFRRSADGGAGRGRPPSDSPLPQRRDEPLPKPVKRSKDGDSHLADHPTNAATVAPQPTEDPAAQPTGE